MTSIGVVISFILFGSKSTNAREGIMTNYFGVSNLNLNLVQINKCPRGHYDIHTRSNSHGISLVQINKCPRGHYDSGWVCG